MCVATEFWHFCENRSLLFLIYADRCVIGTEDCKSFYLEGILLIHHNVFLVDLCFSLIFITQLICMKMGSLFRRDALDPDVCFVSSCNLVCHCVGCGKMEMMANKGLTVQGISTCNWCLPVKTLFPCTSVIWCEILKTRWGKGNHNNGSTCTEVEPADAFHEWSLCRR